MPLLSRFCVNRVRFLILLMLGAFHVLQNPSAAKAQAAINVDEQILTSNMVGAGASGLASYVDCAFNPVDGCIHVAFASPTGGIYHGVRTTLGWQINRVDSLRRGNAGVPDAGPLTRLAFDSFGVGHLVYVDTRFKVGVSSTYPQIRYRTLRGGAWSSPEPTTLGAFSDNTLVDLQLAVSRDGSSVAVVGKRGDNAPVIAQVRTAAGWQVPASLDSAGWADITATMDGHFHIGLASQSGIATIHEMASDGTWPVTATLFRSHVNIRHIAIAGTVSQAGDLHAASGDGAEGFPARLRYWVRQPGLGWNPTYLPEIPTQDGQQLQLSLGPNTGLPWFLTTKGTGGKANGAQLQLSYASGNQFITMPLEQALAVNYASAGFSRLCAAMTFDNQNRCHVVMQELTPDYSLKLRHLEIQAMPPAGVTDGPSSSPPSQLRMPSVVYGHTVNIAVASVSNIASARSIDIYDVMGHRVWRASIGAEAHEIVADLGDAACGVYFVRMRSDRGATSARFIMVQ